MMTISSLSEAFTDAPLRKKAEDLGIELGHSYSILNVKVIDDFTHIGVGGDIRNSKCWLKLRNPHGSGEWKGDWADDSEKWLNHTDIMEDLDIRISDDGNFWMELRDIQSYFTGIIYAGCVSTGNLSEKRALSRLLAARN
jgi:hypothetical protein